MELTSERRPENGELKVRDDPQLMPPGTAVATLWRMADGPVGAGKVVDLQRALFSNVQIIAEKGADTMMLGDCRVPIMWAGRGDIYSFRRHPQAVAAARRDASANNRSFAACQEMARSVLTVCLELGASGF